MAAVMSEFSTRDGPGFGHSSGRCGILPKFLVDPALAKFLAGFGRFQHSAVHVVCLLLKVIKVVSDCHVLGDLMV